MPRSRARKRYADNENGEEEEECPNDSSTSEVGSGPIPLTVDGPWRTIMEMEMDHGVLLWKYKFN